MNLTKINYLPLKILNFATFLQYQRFLIPISFLFYIHNGLTFSEFILFQSIYNATVLIAKIPMGMIGDFISKKYVLIISYFLFMLRVILWISFSGYAAILAGEILYGLFKAMFRGNVDSYIYDWIQKTNNSSVTMVSRYGKLSFWTSLGSAVSCLAGAFLYKHYGFKILLYIELVFQIIALSLLFLLPNFEPKQKINFSKPDFSNLYNKIKNDFSVFRLFKPNVTGYVYYSAMLTGLTSIFVWNFQPLLKACSAPIILFGVISFINQVLRGVGGILSGVVTTNWNKQKLINIEYFLVILSFVSLFYAHNYTNIFSTVSGILIVCLCICFFVIFNVYTVSKIHENTQNYNRATTSSTNTFLGDFSSFIMLLIFKFLYDSLGWNYSFLIFLFIMILVMFPKFKIFKRLA